MKSKPSNKKVKVEVTSLGPPGTPDNSKTTTPSLSPAGSTSSTTSSLLSIGPPTYTFNNRSSIPEFGSLVVPASVVGGGTGKISNAKAKAAAANPSNNGGDKGGASTAAVGAQVTSIHASYPILTHYNLADFPKINACIVGNKGGAPGVGNSNAVPGVLDSLPNKPIDNLTMDDIDTLQAELETLWSSVATRIRLLHREQSLLESSTSSTTHHHNLTLEHFDPQHQEKIAAVATIIDHGTRTSVSAAAKLVMASQIPSGNSPVPSPATSQTGAGTTKRATTAKGERLPKKKLKGEAGGKSKKGGSDKPAARATQNRSHSVSSDLGGEAFKHHEAPSLLWEWVETYCREITKDDLSQLSGLMEEQDKLSADVFDIPPLGKHYKDDEETAKTKARESKNNNSSDSIGTLTQRLVTALVEERVHMHQNQINLHSPKEDAGLATTGVFIHRQGLARALGLDGGPNIPSLDNRIRDCLVDNGLLLPEDANDSILLNPDDEILAEIKRTQSVFKKLYQYNSEKLVGLYNTGRSALEGYTQQKDLEKADKDVLDAYKTIASCRLKKKPLTKKEKDAATKALEARKAVLSKLGYNCGTNSTGGGSGTSTLSASVAPVDPTCPLRVQV